MIRGYTHYGESVRNTYGKSYPVLRRLLRPTPVDYVTETLTPPQKRLFDEDQGHTEAVNLILQECCPFDLVAGVQQFRYFQKHAHKLQRDLTTHVLAYRRALETAHGLLSDLENVDAFKRIINLIEAGKRLPHVPHNSFAELERYVASVTTKWGAHPDRRTSPPRQRRHPIEAFVASSPVPKPPVLHHKDLPHKVACKVAQRDKVRPFLKGDFRCYNCHGIGHFRQQCPTKTRVPWHLRK